MSRSLEAAGIQGQSLVVRDLRSLIGPGGQVGATAGTTLSGICDGNRRQHMIPPNGQYVVGGLQFMIELPQSRYFFPAIFLIHLHLQASWVRWEVVQGRPVPA